MAIGIKSEIKTGPAGSLKRDAVNAEALVAEQAKQAAIEIKEDTKAAPSGSLIYKARGYPVFNCFAPNRQRISFISGMYILEADHPYFDEFKKTLDYHAATGAIELVEEIK